MKYLIIIGLMVSVSAKAFETAYADSMIQVAGQKPPEEGVLFMLDNFYSIYSKNYEDGIEWGEKSLQYATSFGNDQYIGRANLALGTIWYLRGDYEVCLQYYQVAQRIFEEINDDCMLGRTYNQMSVYNRKQKQYKKGLEDLDKSFQLCQSCGDQECLETSVNNRGVIYEMMGDYDQALFYYRKAQSIAIENENDLGLSYIYNNLAECHRLMENYDSVMYYVELSTEIRIKIKDDQGVAMNYANLGEMMTLAGRYEDAESYLNKALKITQEINYLDLERHTNELLFKLYKERGQMDEALVYLDRSLLLKDSILSVEKIKSLSDMEVRYETAKIEKNYAEEQQLRAEADLKASNRRNWIIGITGAALIALFLGLFLYQRRIKRAQEEKNKAVLEEKAKGLEAVFDATEEERQRIAKDLHDGVGQQMSGLKLAWENLTVEINKKDPKEAEKLKELSEILNETAQEVREISHQMMPKVLSEFGLIPALEEMLDKSLKFSDIKAEYEHFNIKDRFPERVELSIYRIAQELINNVIKHSGASQVSVQLFQNKSQLILIVEDNGSGFVEVDNEGHGLLNIKSRLNTINGEVNYEASSERGTMATIRVDLSAMS